METPAAERAVPRPAAGRPRHNSTVVIVKPKSKPYGTSGTTGPSKKVVVVGSKAVPRPAPLAGVRAQLVTVAGRERLVLYRRPASTDGTAPRTTTEPAPKPKTTSDDGMKAKSNDETSSQTAAEVPAKPTTKSAVGAGGVAVKRREGAGTAGDRPVKREEEAGTAGGRPAVKRPPGLDAAGADAGQVISVRIANGRVTPLAGATRAGGRPPVRLLQPRLEAGLWARTVGVHPPPPLPRGERTAVPAVRRGPAADPDSGADPASGPATDPASKPATDPAPRPATDPAPRPATDPAPRPATDPAPRPATDPASRPAADPASRADQASGPAADPAAGFVSDLTSSPATDMASTSAFTGIAAVDPVAGLDPASTSAAKLAFDLASNLDSVPVSTSYSDFASVPFSKPVSELSSISASHPSPIHSSHLAPTHSPNSTPVLGSSQASGPIPDRTSPPSCHQLSPPSSSHASFPFPNPSYSPPSVPIPSQASIPSPLPESVGDSNPAPVPSSAPAVSPSSLLSDLLPIPVSTTASTVTTIVSSTGTSLLASLLTSTATSLLTSTATSLLTSTAASLLTSTTASAPASLPASTTASAPASLPASTTASAPASLPASTTAPVPVSNAAFLSACSVASLSASTAASIPASTEAFSTASLPVHTAVSLPASITASTAASLPASTMASNASSAAASVLASETFSNSISISSAATHTAASGAASTAASTALSTAGSTAASTTASTAALTTASMAASTAASSAAFSTAYSAASSTASSTACRAAGQPGEAERRPLTDPAQLAALVAELCATPGLTWSRAGRAQLAARKRPRDDRQELRLNEFGLVELVGSGARRSPAGSDPAQRWPDTLCCCSVCGTKGCLADFLDDGAFCSQVCCDVSAGREAIKRKKIKLMERKQGKPASTDTDIVSTKKEEAKKELQDELWQPVVFPGGAFSWPLYLRSLAGMQPTAAPLPEPAGPPPPPPLFRPGHRLEAVDPSHPALVCVTTVTEVTGTRLRLHFDGYSMRFDFWVDSDSLEIFPAGWTERHRPAETSVRPPAGWPPQTPFVWAEYLLQRAAVAAPEAAFACSSEQQPAGHRVESELRVGQRLEAADPTRPRHMRPARLVQLAGRRVLIAFDGPDSADSPGYWADLSSPRLRPVTWAEENGVSLLPPSDWGPEPFSWQAHLVRTRSLPVLARLLRTQTPPAAAALQPGVRLEAVDIRVPALVRVMHVREVVSQGLVRLRPDGWRAAQDQWVAADGGGLYPPGWSRRCGHPLTPPVTRRQAAAGCRTASCAGLGHSGGPRYRRHLATEQCPYRGRPSAPPDRLTADLPEEQQLDSLERPPSPTAARRVVTLCRDISAVASEVSDAVFDRETPADERRGVWPRCGRLRGVDRFLADHRAVHLWGAATVAGFLRQCGAGQRPLAAFREEEIDGEALLLLTRQDLCSLLRLPLGTAVKVYNCIVRLRKHFNYRGQTVARQAAG